MLAAVDASRSGSPGRARARYHTRCCRPEPLHRPLRPPKRGALRHAHAVCAMHVHASHHLLTPTVTTVTGLAPIPLLTRASPLAASRRQSGRCEAAARRLPRGGLPRRPPRWPVGSSWPLHGCAGRRGRPRRVAQHGKCACGAPGAGRSVLGSRVQPRRLLVTLGHGC